MTNLKQTESVTVPKDVSSAWVAAIKSVRLAIAATEAWSATSSEPIRFVLVRPISWWKRAISLTETLMLITEE